MYQGIVSAQRPPTATIFSLLGPADRQGSYGTAKSELAPNTLNQQPTGPSFPLYCKVLQSYKTAPRIADHGRNSSPPS